MKDDVKELVEAAWEIYNTPVHQLVVHNNEKLTRLDRAVVAVKRNRGEL